MSQRFSQRMKVPAPGRTANAWARNHLHDGPSGSSRLTLLAVTHTTVRSNSCSAAYGQVGRYAKARNSNGARPLRYSRLLT